MQLVFPPLPFAVSFADGLAEWPEVVLAAGLAFVAAYFIAAFVARLIRWAFHTALGPTETGQLKGAIRRPVFIARLLIFLLMWAVLSVPLLDAIGLPLEVGMNRTALRHWLLASGLRILAIVVLAWLVLRITVLTTDRLSRELSRGEGVDVIERTKRAHTLSRLVHNVLAFVVSGIALLMVLRELGMDIVPMLTGAGIVGVALGFGAQWLVRDLIAGFYLILDNQVRVGDVAVINGVGGVVEAINLRTIVLRDVEGTVHVFQNGAINTLANRSKDFSYYVIDLNVAYGQDLDRVTAVVRQTGKELLADERLRPSILEPLEVLGIDAFLDTKITIKLRIKTLPLKQWEVGRELRRRLVMSFEREQIALTPSALPMLVQRQPRPTSLSS